MNSKCKGGGDSRQEKRRPDGAPAHGVSVVEKSEARSQVEEHRRAAPTKDGEREKGRGKRKRIPSEWLSSTMDEILEAVGLRERQFLYRYLGKKIGVHPTTILRYHLGELATTPLTLYREARNLLRSIRMGEAVSFVRGGERGEVVVRERFVEQLDDLLKIGLFQRKTELFRLVEKKCGLRKGLVERIYYDRKRRFVDEGAHQCAVDLARRSEYDPTYTYHRGDRLIHPLFGIGSVVRKVPRDKVLVKFDDGIERELCENIKEDPYRRMR